FLAELTTGGTRIRVVVGCAQGGTTGSTDSQSDLQSAILALQATMAREHLDRAFLVTLDSVDSTLGSLAADATVILLRQDERETRLIDFSGYLREVVHDYEHFDEFADFGRIPVIEPFRWCDLQRFYIDVACIDPLTGREYDGARAAFREFVADPG